MPVVLGTHAVHNVAAVAVAVAVAVAGFEAFALSNAARPDASKDQEGWEAARRSSWAARGITTEGEDPYEQSVVNWASQSRLRKRVRPLDRDIERGVAVEGEPFASLDFVAQSFPRSESQSVRCQYNLHMTCGAADFADT
jgi:hypothetical protein